MAGARTFRVFISSTFSDLVHERNLLQERAFPALERLCLDNGARFQAIDLRWGVSDEAALDQQTMNICLAEVDRCRAISPRPNFLVLLGDRYGWRPLPPQIPAAEYDEIGRRVGADDRARMDAWYALDRNAVPPVYDLVARDPEGAHVDHAAWDRVERELRAILLRGAAGMPAAERFKYEASATEQEIDRGALASPDAHEHVFCFIRSIDGLPQDATAGEFVDLDPGTGAPEADAPARLAALKRSLREHLPGHVEVYPARWSGSKPVLADPDRFCGDVVEALSGVIRRQLESSALDERDRLTAEVAAHERFGAERTSSGGRPFFVGREDVLDRIGTYIARPGGRPLAIVGPSGSGKSALVAFAAREARRRRPDATVVVRHVGATPESSDARQLLIGIAGQISLVYERDEGEIPTEWNELVEDLPRRLAFATAERPLIVFLDALDQLSGGEGGRATAWLPDELPEHVALIVSATESAAPARPAGGTMVRLDRFGAEDGARVLERWLADAGRTLQPHQRDEVLEKFRAEALPLYLKLAFEEARRWKSYTPPGRTVLGSDIPGVIRRNFFARLAAEENHGSVVVSGALGYLAAAKNGLSEDEMIHVLSRDAGVLADFKRRSPRSPDVDMLPIVLWSRLYFDLEPYLADRDADGASLLTFYHRRIADAAGEEFGSGDAGLRRHRALAAYFDEAPLEVEGAGDRHANLRKLSELPYQQAMGELWDEAFATLTDFSFLERKAAESGVVSSRDASGNPVKTYTGIYLIREDLERVLGRMPGGAGPVDRGSRRLVVTAVDFGAGLEIRCPHCNGSFPFRNEMRGREVACPRAGCGRPLRVNTFVVERRP